MADLPTDVAPPQRTPSAATGADPKVPSEEIDDPDLEKFYSTEQVGHLFSVASETVVHWIQDGKLRAIKIDRRYRIPKSAIIQFANERYNS